MKDNKRLPRPEGSTEIGHTYNKGGIERDKVEDNLIGHYVRTGFMYNGISMSIEAFCNYTKIESDRVFQAITMKGKDVYNMVDPNEQGEVLKALLGAALSGALSDRSAALRQLSILQSAQGNGYKAFISGEVNKALKLTQDSTSGILAIAKSLGGSQGLNVIVNNNNGDQVQNNQYLTSDRAVELMQANTLGPTLISNQEAKQALYAKHGIDDMPVVKANEQRGLDVAREGLAFDKLASLSDDKVDKVEHKDHHITRREDELGIDTDDDTI